MIDNSVHMTAHLEKLLATHPMEVIHDDLMFVLFK